MTDNDEGMAGASARREHERRRANRERRVRERHPRIGGALLALSDEPQHQRAWARGAEGEARVAASLAKRLHPDVVLLHDRRVPGTRANIDHIAVAPSGVWVIDTKRYKGSVAVHQPLFGSAKLLIAGRDKTKLVDGLDRQVALVRSVVGPSVAVHGALCFVDAELPMLRTPAIRGHVLAYPGRLAKRVNAAGPLAAGEVQAVAAGLADSLPRA